MTHKEEMLAKLDGFENLDKFFKQPASIFGKMLDMGTQDGKGESDDILGRELVPVPDYLNSYDAIIPLVHKLISRHTCHSFFDALGEIAIENWGDVDGTPAYEGDGSYFELWVLYKASPSEIADALLSAFGKLK